MPFSRRDSKQSALPRGAPHDGVTLCLVACWLVIALLTSAGLLYWVVFRDDVLEALLRRQADMKQAYEDRLASLNAQVDRMASRKLLDQNTIEGRVRELASRQALLESRSATIAALLDQIGASPDTTTPIARSSPAPVLPAPSVTAPPVAADKPRPQATIELRSSLHSAAPASTEKVANPDIQLSAIGRDLERIERDQVQALASIGSSAKRKSARLSAIINEVGLSVERLAPRGRAVGGPFEPINTGSHFDRELSRIAVDHQAASRLLQIIHSLPLRQPLAGSLEIASGYGPRMDPFVGRMALHTGLDMQDEAGALVRSTGGGNVVSAGWSGGYGNMVEIDHGHDLTTRYGHLSSINVTEGQAVAPGAIIGRVGSTGRSTGPHLHYEVRIDGEPVDPGRFLAPARGWLN